VQLLTENARLLHAYGHRVRRTEARALHREGLTMDEIARLFGVSRQRVSALLRDPDPSLSWPGDGEDGDET
jgi:predicted transcriptional regulator